MASFGWTGGGGRCGGGQTAGVALPSEAEAAAGGRRCGAPSRSGERPASSRMGRTGGIGRTSSSCAGRCRQREQSSKEQPMRVALYVRVSTDRQQQAQTIEQQVTQLRAYVAARDGWTVAEEHVLRDDGHSGAKLNRPGLDALRDHAARAAFDVVLVTAPDRLARNFTHQMVVLEELQRRGVPVVFCDRPLSDDPHEQLVTQIRGAVAWVRADPDRRPDAPRPAGAAAQRAAAAVDAGALRLPAAS